MKIYSDDPLVHYKDSTLSIERTRAEIDALLGAWKVIDAHWHWDPDHNDIWVGFLIEEVIDERPVKVSVKVVCPIIWDKALPRSKLHKIEKPNLVISMRALWWFIKTNLEMAYAMRSSKTVAFLAFITSSSGVTVKDYLIPRIANSQFEALPENLPPKPPEHGKVIEA